MKLITKQTQLASLFVLTGALAVACGEDPPGNDVDMGGSGGSDPSGGRDGSGGDATGGSDATGGMGGDMGGSGGSGGGETLSFDCNDAPETLVGTEGKQKVLRGPRGYHGLAIDSLGKIYGDTNSKIIAASYDKFWVPFADSFGSQQMEFAENGDLIIASAGSIVGITPEAQYYTLTSEVSNAYGLRVGPDGMIYAMDDYRFYRIDPDSGDTEVLLELESDWNWEGPFDGGWGTGGASTGDVAVPVGGGSMGGEGWGGFGGGCWDCGSYSQYHSFDFSPNFDRLYIGTIGQTDQVRVVALDEDFDPVGEPQAFANLEPEDGSGSWTDAVAVDACGNLYAPNYFTRKLYRVTPEGEVSVFYDWYENGGDGTGYGHGAIFGNGKGGFREDALYLPMPYDDNKVQEIIVGVPGRDFKGDVKNAKPHKALD